MEKQTSRAVTPFVTAAALVVAVLCDLPGSFRAGGLSGSALLSIVVAGLGLVTLPALLKAPNQAAITPLLPFAAFATWATVLAVLVGSDTAGFQNIAVYWLFVTVAVITGAFSSDEGADRAQRFLVYVGWALAALYALSLAMDGLGSGAIFGRRSFALTALLLMAFTVPMIDHGRLARWLPWVLFLLIAASLSRTALVVAAILVAVRAAYTRRGLRLGRVVLLIAAAVGGLFWAVENVAVLRDRFTGGDQAFQIGGLTISSQGRDLIWRVVLGDIDTAPILGHGPGAVSAIIKRNIPSQAEPHNDFFRALYDTGYIGLTLFVLGLSALLVAAGRRAIRTVDRQDKASHVGAFLALLAYIAGAMTDNALIYSFVMAPLAVIVGLSLSKPLPPKLPRRERTPRLSRDQARRADELARLERIRAPRP